MYNKNSFCFLTYLNRSGSTLLAQKLSQFDDIGVGIEAKLIDGIQRGKVYITSKDQLEDYLNKNYQDPKFTNWKIPKEKLKNNILEKYEYPINFYHFLYEAFNNYFNQQPKKVYIHKQGRYYNHIKTVRNVFPGAKFIFIDRDPRAIYNSQVKSRNSTDGQQMQKGIISFARSYLNTQKIVKKYAEKDFFHIVGYEELIKNEHREISKILSFLELDNVKKQNAQNYLERIPAEQRYLHQNLKENANKTERINAWEKELNDWEIFFLEKVLKNPIIEKYGYRKKINFISINNKGKVLRLLLWHYIQNEIILNIKNILKKIIKDN